MLVLQYSASSSRLLRLSVLTSKENTIRLARKPRTAEPPLHLPRTGLPHSSGLLYITMAAIRSLLNPLPEAVACAVQLPSPCSTASARDFTPPPPSRKKQKLSKDAAVFSRGIIRGECRYPPCEYRDEALAAYHQQYEIHPLGHIAEYPRHIPYNSEKKSFLDKTGRESFEGMPSFANYSWTRLIGDKCSSTHSGYQAMKGLTA